MANPFIEFKEVSKTFGKHQVLDRVNLKIYEGEITAIIGKSGAGKSVLLKHIIGLLKPDSGKILIKGKALEDFTKEEWRNFKRSLSYMFQSNALFDSLTVFQNIALPLVERTKLSQAEIKKRVDFRIEQFELGEVAYKYPSQISGGMQKRVALARALVTEPTMILFDEPTTGLDPMRKNAVLNMIAHYQREIGFTGVMVSHDIPDVFFISNRVAIIENKRVPFQGTPLELEQSDNEVVWQFIHGQEVLQDQLTGLNSRKEFETAIKDIFKSQSAKGTKPCQLILFTIDSLEEIKSQVGYIAAQRIFQCLAMSVKMALPATALATRWGKEEIVVLLPDMDEAGASEILEKILKDCSSQDLMKASSYKKLCVDFQIKAGIWSLDADGGLDAAIENARKVQKLVAKMECHGSRG